LVEVFNLDWQHIFCVHSHGDPEVEELLQQYPTVFSGETGTIKGFKADLRLREEATPVFYK
jgi:hypothetical protein